MQLFPIFLHVAKDHGVTKSNLACLSSCFLVFLWATHPTTTWESTTFRSCFSSLSFRVLYLISSATSFSIAFCLMIRKYSSKVTIKDCEQSINGSLPFVFLTSKCGSDNNLENTKSWVRFALCFDFLKVLLNFMVQIYHWPLGFLVTL